MSRFRPFRRIRLDHRLLRYPLRPVRAVRGQRFDGGTGDESSRRGFPAWSAVSAIAFRCLQRDARLFTHSRPIKPNSEHEIECTIGTDNKIPQIRVCTRSSQGLRCLKVEHHETPRVSATVKRVTRRQRFRARCALNPSECSLQFGGKKVSVRFAKPRATSTPLRRRTVSRIVSTRVSSQASPFRRRRPRTVENASRRR